MSEQSFIKIRETKLSTPRSPRVQLTYLDTSGRGRVRTYGREHLDQLLKDLVDTANKIAHLIEVAEEYENPPF